MSPQIDMDELFDLDLALTAVGEDDSTDGGEHHSDGEAAAVGEMPTVIMEGCGGECRVCMEELGGGAAAKRVPCAHVFHENCISKWLSFHNSCPLCRRPIISI